MRIEQFGPQKTGQLVPISGPGVTHAFIPEEWIRFCLTGVRAQATDTLKRCEKLVALREDYHERLRGISGGSVRLSAIVDDLFRTPVALPARVAAKQRVSYPTARADLTKLVKAGVLEELSPGARISFYSRAIFDITYAD